MKNRCCICDSESSRLYDLVGDFKLLQCDCGLVYLDRNVSKQEDFIEAAEKDLRSTDKQKVEYWSFPQQFDKHRKVFERFFDERIKRIKKHNPNVEDMLDVGCGYGFWMDYCKNLGIRSQGIDISPEVVDYAKTKLNLDVTHSDLVGFEPKKKYDLIMMFDVVEHLENPNEVLTKYHGFLKDDGLLYVQVPDLIGFRIPSNHGYGLPHHLWQFNFKTMKKLLEKNNYSVEGRWSGPIGVIGDYEKGKHLFFKEIMWSLTSKLHIAPRLQVIAK